MTEINAQDAPFLMHIHTAQQRQAIDNFGASDAWSMNPIGKEWSDDEKNRIADLLFDKEKGIGLSLWRFNIGAGGNLPGKAKLSDPWRGVECFKDTAAMPYDWIAAKRAAMVFARCQKARRGENFGLCEQPSSVAHRQRHGALR